MSELDPGQAPKQPESRERRVFFRVLLDASILITAISASLFLLGWAYLVGWYGVFGLDLETLDFSVYLMLVAFLNPLVDLFKKLLLGDLIICGLILCASVLFVISETFYVRRLTRGTLTKLQHWLSKSWLSKNRGTLKKFVDKTFPASSTLRMPEGRVSVTTLSWLRMALVLPFIVPIVLLPIARAYKEGKTGGRLEYQQPSTKITLGFKKMRFNCLTRSL